MIKLYRKIINWYRILNNRRRKRFFLYCGQGVDFGSPNLISIPTRISIGKYTTFADGLFLTAWSKAAEKEVIRIGSHCKFGEMNHITAMNKILIGDYVLTGKWVTITDNSHGKTDKQSLHEHPSNREMSSKGPVVIGNDVWIGDKATILAGVTIGDGVVIGANAVVTHDIPSYSVAVGNPATVVTRNCSARL